MSGGGNAAPCGFLIHAPNPDDQPATILFIRDRPDAETVLAFRQNPKFPPGAAMRPVFWDGQDFTFYAPAAGATTPEGLIITSLDKLKPESGDGDS